MQTKFEYAAHAVSEGAEIIEAGGGLLATWERDDESVAEVAGERKTIDVEITYRLCGHHGNCPCAQGERTVKVDVIEFADGSVWAEDVEGGSWGEYDADERFVEAVTEWFLADNPARGRASW
jgi:hypothetical protein